MARLQTSLGTPAETESPALLHEFDSDMTFQFERGFLKHAKAEVESWNFQGDIFSSDQEAKMIGAQGQQATPEQKTPPLEKESCTEAESINTSCLESGLDKNPRECPQD